MQRGVRPDEIEEGQRKSFEGLREAPGLKERAALGAIHDQKGDAEWFEPALEQIGVRSGIAGLGQSA